MVLDVSPCTPLYTRRADSFCRAEMYLWYIQIFSQKFGYFGAEDQVIFHNMLLLGTKPVMAV